MATANPGPVSRSAVSGIDIRLANDIAISFGVAARIVDLIELLRKILARQNGCQLTETDVSIQRLLRECVDLRGTYADASTKVVSSEDVLPSNSELLTPEDVAAQLGIKPAGVRWHCVHNGLGRKFGNRWLIDGRDLQMFKATRGKGVA